MSETPQTRAALLAERIVAVMRSRQLSQEDVARESQVSQATISNLLSPGRRRKLRLATALKLEVYLDRILGPVSLGRERCLRPGHRIAEGRYEIVDEIGTGSLGTVYKAIDYRYPVHDGLAKLVAVKILAPEISKESKRRFLDNVRNTARLPSHPHVCPVHDWGFAEKDGQFLPYAVLELLERSVTRADVSADMSGNLKALLQATLGLEHAQRHSLVHGNIKPSNLLWSCDWDRVLVSDFGLSWQKSEAESNDRPSHDLSPLHFAPEQFTLTEWDCLPVDIYQLGVTFYELLTGNLPFGGVEESALIESIPTGPPKPPRDHDPRVPDRISNLVLQMLEQDPRARPQSYRVICEVLEGELRTHASCRDEVTRATLLECPVLSTMREALARKVARVVLSFSDPNCPAVPRANEHDNWYATVLLRASRDGARLTDHFYPIFFANFRGMELYASSDWIKTPELMFCPLDIQRCASGLPIRWYREARAWAGRRVDDEFITCEVDSSQRIRAFVLRKVQKARFDSSIPDNLIRSTYATDNARASWNRGVGWSMSMPDGEPVPMSQAVQTEIIIPIYSPSAVIPCREHDILGVANFEWDEALSEPRERHIRESLTRQIQENHRFPISLFTCDVLGHVMGPEEPGRPQV